FRMEWKWDGTEPGAEDLDAAKFVNSLSILRMNLSGEPKMNQFEGKSAAVWRVGANTTPQQVPQKLCVDPSEMITLDIDTQGRVDLSRLPEGRWRILRMGQTSTGHDNATAGAAKGLECDKFNPEAVQLQFDNWFGMIYNRVGKEVAQRVIRFVHIDSWECGSQNWTDNFPEEFKKRRGYDLMPWLPLYAGVPMASAEKSDKVLLDIRETAAELVVDVFHEVFSTNAHKYNCEFSTENVSPTQTSDGMLHFQKVDVPMGEFWLRSPTHDKPMDMLDAIHGAHIYGKNRVAAEAFTQLRIQWDEHPGLLKRLGDLHYALGVNMMVYHVYVHNPWLTWKPGMTLDGIGWYFQRDQIWWPHAKGWIDYARRCQLMLQKGRPVVDVAVFTGEDIPRRSVLPDRLVPSLPGIFGPEQVESERVRMLNEGQPAHTVFTVRSAKNFTPLSEWVDPLKGYSYDSFNKDVLLQSKAVDGRMVLPSGASYRVVIFLLPYKMTMNDELFRSAEVEAKIRELRDAGVVVLTDGQGLPYHDTSFEKYGLERDFVVSENGVYAQDIAWNHRATETSDLYFISNQQEENRTITVSLRGMNKFPVIWDPVTGEKSTVYSNIKDGRTEMQIVIPASGSLFIEMQPDPVLLPIHATGSVKEVNRLEPWQITFEGKEGTLHWDELKDWTELPDWKYYSGRAVYETDFQWRGSVKGQHYLDLGRVGVMAEVFVNDRSCGIVWTPPYRVNISDALKKGRNTLRIEVTNVWSNYLNGIKTGEVSAEGMYHNSPHKFKEDLIPSGLMGPVTVISR
ncbi:MAG: DNA-binding protein, partial [Rikenellaceae bacterium]|nr:DNA-binding protein [Rikenellaceae bacterium]